MSELSDFYSAEHIAQVTAVATKARVFLEGQWAELRALRGWQLPPGIAPSHNMCRFSALFLRDLLTREVGGEWSVVGGTSCRDEEDWVDREYGFPGGLRDARGRWHAHYWVVDGGDSLIADVAADQFGGPAVVLTIDQPGCYRDNYCADAIQTHVHREVAGRVDEWMEAYNTQGATPGPRR